VVKAHNPFTAAGKRPSIMPPAAKDYTDLAYSAQLQRQKLAGTLPQGWQTHDFRSSGATAPRPKSPAQLAAARENIKKAQEARQAAAGAALGRSIDGFIRSLKK
jgi:hypothetical protein